MAKIKICGIRRVDDARLATELGASALGFVFWPSSPRFIDPYRARPIVEALPPFVTSVGVFVNQSWEFITDVAGLLGLGAVQLHGDEPMAMYSRSAWRVIKAVPVASGDDTLASRVAGVPSHATVLLDAHDPMKRGGTGRPIDWTQAAAVSRMRRIVLSGGLTAENVGAAIEAVEPYAIDVSSGVESAPGIKDAAKMRALFESVFSVQEAQRDARERAHGHSR
jgi:phosphoribosylanthranilate isomerase